jgi:ribonuclease HI
MVAKKFYVVWAGLKPGVYDNWPEAQRQVKGIKAAKYKSFFTEAAARAAYTTGAPASIVSATGEAKGGAENGSTEKSRTSSVSSTVELIDTDVQIYCDGGCEPNPGEAGTGIVVYRDKKVAELWYGLYTPKGTNNTAELLGLHHSLMMAEQELQQGRSVSIHCDSQYAINCISVWAPSWQKNGWVKKDKKPVLNLNIIQPAFELYTKIGKLLTIKYVKGHAGIEGNELADRMTTLAIQQQETDLSLLSRFAR